MTSHDSLHRNHVWRAIWVSWNVFNDTTCRLSQVICTSYACSCISMLFVTARFCPYDARLRLWGDCIMQQSQVLLNRHWEIWNKKHVFNRSYVFMSCNNAYYQMTTCCIAQQMAMCNPNNITKYWLRYIDIYVALIVVRPRKQTGMS